jgi:hypothetical protein
LKPGAWEQMEALSRRWEREQAPKAPGFKGEYLLREAGSPNRCINVVLFADRQLAQQNSERPETNQYYRDLLELTEGEPEFIDAEVVHSYLI